MQISISPKGKQDGHSFDRKSFSVTAGDVNYIFAESDDGKLIITSDQNLVVQAKTDNGLTIQQNPGVWSEWKRLSEEQPEPGEEVLIRTKDGFKVMTFLHYSKMTGLSGPNSTWSTPSTPGRILDLEVYRFKTRLPEKEDELPVQ